MPSLRRMSVRRRRDQKLDICMKLPKWDGVTGASDYLFFLVCFVVGYAAISALSLGRIKYDDREGPGWNPVSRMPDGKIGLSRFAIKSIGFVVLGVGVAAFFGLGLLWRHIRLS
jgi:hypothetical protein